MVMRVSLPVGLTPRTVLTPTLGIVRDPFLQNHRWCYIKFWFYIVSMIPPSVLDLSRVHWTQTLWTVGERVGASQERNERMKNTPCS